MSLLVILSTCVMEDGQTATSVQHHHNGQEQQRPRVAAEEEEQFDCLPLCS